MSYIEKSDYIIKKNVLYYRKHPFDRGGVRRIHLSSPTPRRPFSQALCRRSGQMH